jgi:nucleotide-binding universal stress UspA family protein
VCDDTPRDLTHPAGAWFRFRAATFERLATARASRHHRAGRSDGPRGSLEMTFRDVLVHLDSGSRAPERLELAIALARRHGARLTGLFAESAVLGQSLVGRRAPEAMAKAAQAARAAFEARASASGVAPRWWQVEPGEFADVVGAAVQCCRYVDVAVFGQQRGDDAPVPDGLVERVIAESGRPVVVVPSAGRYPDLGQRVLVAWTGSREAARALHDALPLLEQAKEVKVLSLQLPHSEVPGGLPSLDIAEHLRAHGVKATRERTILADLEAVDVVLNRAADDGADLTVIGAYGLKAGGLLKRGDTTRAILETMTTPVLLSS